MYTKSIKSYTSLAAVRLIGSLWIYWGWPEVARRPMGVRPGGGWGRPWGGWGQPGAAGDGPGAARGLPGTARHGQGRLGGLEGVWGPIFTKSAPEPGAQSAFVPYFLVIFNGRVVKSRGLSPKLFLGRDPDTIVFLQPSVSRRWEATF